MQQITLFKFICTIFFLSSFSQAWGIDFISQFSSKQCTGHTNDQFLQNNLNKLPTIAKSITIYGIEKTRPDVIIRELELVEGAPFNPEQLFISLQKLKNLRIFKTVNYCLRSIDNINWEINIIIVEKYTTMPFIRVNGGGGTNFLAMGILDTNTMGRYLELGGQYENLNGAHGAAVWFKNPRLFEKYYTAEVYLQDRTKVLQEKNKETELKSSYSMRTQNIRFGFSHNIQPWFNLGLGLTVGTDRFSENYLSNSALIANAKIGYLPPIGGFTTFFTLQMLFGEMNYNDYLLDGLTLEIIQDNSFAPIFTEFPFARSRLNLQYFKELPWNSNLGLRISGGTLNKTYAQHKFFIGGYQQIRGFLDSEFNGTKFVSANLEFRVSSLALDWLILQHCFFYDVGAADNSFSIMLSDNYNLPSAAGMGIRFLFPYTTRLNLRLDYAMQLNAKSNGNISFGTQQFF